MSDTPLTDAALSWRTERDRTGYEQRIDYVEPEDARAIERELRDELAAARAKLAAPEQIQRERMEARFANRGKSAQSADCDLPAQSDDFLATEPSRERDMSDDGLLHDRCHTDDGPVRSGRAVRVSETPETEPVTNTAHSDPRVAMMYWHERAMAAESYFERLTFERDALREALRDVMNEADSITGITDATWARAVDILAAGGVT
jgi:hypothetical protein